MVLFGLQCTDLASRKQSHVREKVRGWRTTRHSLDSHRDHLPGSPRFRWLQYSAVPQTEGAPLRTVTVKDVISDLPPIKNGHSEIESKYSGAPLLVYRHCTCRFVRGLGRWPQKAPHMVGYQITELFALKASRQKFTPLLLPCPRRWQVLSDPGHGQGIALSENVSDPARDPPLPPPIIPLLDLASHAECERLIPPLQARRCRRSRSGCGGSRRC